MIKKIFLGGSFLLGEHSFVFRRGGGVDSCLQTGGFGSHFLGIGKRSLQLVELEKVEGQELL